MYHALECNMESSYDHKNDCNVNEGGVEEEGDRRVGCKSNIFLV